MGRSSMSSDRTPRRGAPYGFARAVPFFGLVVATAAMACGDGGERQGVLFDVGGQGAGGAMLGSAARAGDAAELDGSVAAAGSSATGVPPDGAAVGGTSGNGGHGGVGGDPGGGSAG